MNELTFLDLVVLKKIDLDSSVEKFGSIINTSFFETANLLGTLKIKGYVNIEPSVGGASRVAMTDAGAGILALAEQKSKDPIEPLDNAILRALAGGAKELEAMQSALNVRSGDLAYHLSKLVSQGYMDFEVRSAKVHFLLTEQGFNATGGVRVQQTFSPQQPPAQQVSPPGQPEQRKEHAASAPPWVAQIAPQHQKKEDVVHILSGESKEKTEHREKKQEPRRPAGPDEEKRRRLLSKIEYYFKEYSPYIALIIVVLAIFASALFLSLTKLS